MYVRANQPENVIAAAFDEQAKRILFRAVFVVDGVLADNRLDGVDKRARQLSLLIKNMDARKHRRMKGQVVIGVIVFVGRDEAGEHGGQVKRDEDIQTEHGRAIAAQLNPDDRRWRAPARRPYE